MKPSEDRSESDDERDVSGVRKGEKEMDGNDQDADPILRIRFAKMKKKCKQANKGWTGHAIHTTPVSSVKRGHRKNLIVGMPSVFYFNET